MQDLTNLCEKVQKIDFSTFHSKSVKSCMNSWMDLQVDLSELVVAHLVYMNLNYHGHSFNIQCDLNCLDTRSYHYTVVYTLLFYCAKAST